MHKDVVSLCENVTSGSRLLPVLDVQNPVDKNAVALRCEDETILIGYVPTFYAGDVHRILSDSKIASSAKISVIRNNVDAPLQLRLLCSFDATVPLGFHPLNTDVHKLFLEVA
jgi:hypothetical protein